MKNHYYRKMVIALAMAFAVFGSGFVKAANPGWSLNVPDFKNDMAMYVAVQVNDKAVDYSKFTLGAFVGDQCRGLGEVVTAQDASAYYLRIYSNVSSGETVNFKIYDSAADRVLTSASTVEFKSNELIGSFSLPQTINFLVPVSQVTLSPTSQEVQVGGSCSFQATVTPSDAYSTAVTWSSSDTSVATINANGEVSALKAGNTTITAKSYDGVTATAIVTVKNVECNSITLDKQEYSGKQGTTLQLTATVAPANTTDKTVSWTTSDSKIATVSTSGLVSLVAPGKATITASCGSKSASCQITVLAPDLESITLSPATANVEIGGTVKLIPSYSPANAESGNLTWTSSDAKIATVNSEGTVTGVALGTATITVTAGNGVKGTATVTVKAVECNSITLDKQEYSGKPGTTVQLTATIAPANTTDKTVTWTSSNEKIAKVSNTGLVSLLVTGNATITATCGSKSATCKITVESPDLEAIILSPASSDILIGESVTITATYSPENAEVGSLTWSTSNEGVAVVEKGVVTGISTGEAIITASFGKISATVSVSVKAPALESITLSPASSELEIGKTVTLNVSYSPKNAELGTLTWSTSDEKVATVNDGVVTAIGVGEAVIKATSSNGIEGEVVVTVKENTPDDPGKDDGVASIFESGDSVNVYDIQGHLLKGGADSEFVRNLKKGLYILRTKTETVKLIRK